MVCCFACRYDVDFKFHKRVAAALEKKGKKGGGDAVLGRISTEEGELKASLMEQDPKFALEVKDEEFARQYQAMLDGEDVAAPDTGDADAKTLRLMRELADADKQEAERERAERARKAAEEEAASLEFIRSQNWDTDEAADAPGGGERVEKEERKGGKKRPLTLPPDQPSLDEKWSASRRRVTSSPGVLVKEKGEE
jgi:hypothetical protein